jgi:hypothetical protein
MGREGMLWEHPDPDALRLGDVFEASTEDAEALGVIRDKYGIVEFPAINAMPGEPRALVATIKAYDDLDASARRDLLREKDPQEAARIEGLLMRRYAAYERITGGPLSFIKLPVFGAE